MIEQIPRVLDVVWPHEQAGIAGSLAPPRSASIGWSGEVRVNDESEMNNTRGPEISWRDVHQRTQGVGGKRCGCGVDDEDGALGSSQPDSFVARAGGKLEVPIDG